MTTPHTPPPHTEKCACKETSCPEDCIRNHTHKGFSCHVCNPPHTENEWEKLMDEVESYCVTHGTKSIRERGNALLTQSRTDCIREIREKVERIAVGVDQRGRRFVELPDLIALLNAIASTPDSK